VRYERYSPNRERVCVCVCVCVCTFFFFPPFQMRPNSRKAHLNLLDDRNHIIQ
jgi:hypothetical protein